MNLTEADRRLAAGIAAAHPLRKSSVTRTGHVQMLGGDARLSANDEEFSEAELIAADLENLHLKNSGELLQREVDAVQVLERRALAARGML